MTTLITILGWIAFGIGGSVLTWVAFGLSGLVLFYILRWATSISIYGFDEAPKSQLIFRAVQYGAFTLYFVIHYYIIVIREEHKIRLKGTAIKSDKPH